MLKRIAFAATLSASIWQMAAASQLATYINARYGYSISYPAELLSPQREADNGDGRAFQAKIGRARFLVYGGYNALGDSPETLAEQVEGDCPGHRASYRVVKPVLVAVSCETSADILYEKVLIRGDALTTLSARYPKNERAVWNSVVSKMAGSMRAAHAD
jgi:hypothetical protein